MYKLQPLQTLPIQDLAEKANTVQRDLAESPIYLFNNKKKFAVLLAIKEWKKIQRYIWEVSDTDDAIYVAKKEARESKIRRAASFKRILEEAEEL